MFFSFFRARLANLTAYLYNRSMETAGFLHSFLDELTAAFGGRLLFFGLQGSFARGEQTETSDIDIVTVLDELSFEDVELYRCIVSSANFPAQPCGFIAGKAELSAWEKSDLMSLVFDTKPLLGDLFALVPDFSNDDIKHNVRVTVCSIYHACLHNYLYDRSGDILRSLFKSARFAIRMKHFLLTGTFIHSMSELRAAVGAPDNTVISSAQNYTGSPDDFTFYTRTLLDWARSLLCSPLLRPAG